LEVQINKNRYKLKWASKGYIMHKGGCLVFWVNKSKQVLEK